MVVTCGETLMHRIRLLATTVLAASAGAASADISWGASAAAGIASDAGGAFETYSSANLAVTLSGTSDSGLTFGASFGGDIGRTYGFADDDGFGSVNADGDLNAGDFGFGTPTIFVEGSFGKLELSDDNFDFYDDTHGGGDARWSATFGAATVGVTADIDTNNASASVGYTAGALALSANVDTYELWNVSATYTMGAIAVTAATDEASNSSLKVAYTGANGISGSAQYNTSDESIDLSATYAANGLSVTAGTNTVSNHWTVSGSYDLGGGLAVVAGTNYTEDMMVGATMSF